MPTKKNNYNPPTLTDERLKYVPVGCGNCIECRKQKAREWQVRLQEELKSNKLQSYFVTLSFSDESLQEICTEFKTTESNAVAAVAVRRFCERWRKKYKVSIRHWLICELGHTNTERLHLHGIVWTNEAREEITNIWKYGNTWIGDYCNAKTINYIIKYVTKIDAQHKGYKGYIFCSAGLGGNYTKSVKAIDNRFAEENTREFYQLESGSRVNMPIYYRNRLYTEEQREKLWLHRTNKQERYVMGIKYDISTQKGWEMYQRALVAAQSDNIKLGYGSDQNEWSWKPYNVTVQKIRKAVKAQKIRNSARVEQEKSQKNDKFTHENLQE